MPRAYQVQDQDVLWRARVTWTYEDGHTRSSCYGPYIAKGPATQQKNRGLREAVQRKESGWYREGYYVRDGDLHKYVESKIVSITGEVDSGTVNWVRYDG